MIKALLILMLLCGEAWATDYCASAVGCFLMEDSGDETDRSTNYDNTLTAHGGTISQSTDKKFGTYSRSFTRASRQFMDHADGLSTDINGANANMSFGGWVKLNNLSSTNGESQYFIVKYDNGNSQRQYRVGFETNNLISAAFSNDGTNATTATSSSTMTAGVWTHVFVVDNDVDIRVYKNGTLDGTPPSYTPGIFNGSSRFKIGSRTTSTSDLGFLDGLADDVGIFNTALTSTDVSTIYTYGLSPSSSGIPTSSQWLVSGMKISGQSFN